MVSLTCNLEKQQIISLSKYRNSSNAQYFVNILSWNDREGMTYHSFPTIPSIPMHSRFIIKFHKEKPVLADKNVFYYEFPDQCE